MATRANEVKGLRRKLTEEDKDKILADFQETLLDFCESVIPNGSRRGDEWDCGDIFNSEREEGDNGSCSVNLVSGVFHDHNPEASPQSGNAYTLFSAITGLKGAKAYRAMQQWNEDRTLPDGTAGVRSDRKVELSEGSTIEAVDDFERDRIKWIGVFQDWRADVIERGIGYKPGCGYKLVEWPSGKEVDTSPAAQAAYIAVRKEKYDNFIAWGVSDIFSRRWLQAVECTQEVREKFADELAEMRGLSKEVFLWLIDTGNIALLYERKEIKQAPVKIDEWENRWEEPPPKVIEYRNIAFPVDRNVALNEYIPDWAGGRDFIDAGHPPSKLSLSWREREEMRKKRAPTVFFYGMHTPYIDKYGHKHWCYKPKGCPAHPYIIGDVATADLVVIAESTWDVIAYLDLRKLWAWTKHTWAVIATRGAGNAQRIPADQIKEGAVVVRLLQNDAGNAAWVVSLPYMPQAEQREIQPPEGIKDLNDWMREAGAEKVLQAIW